MRRLAPLLLLATLLAIAACTLREVARTEPAAAPAPAASTADNALLANWTGPYGGVPAFDRLAVAPLQPAMRAAMGRNLRELDAIANDPAPPTFENTIVALESTGRDLERVSVYYSILAGNVSGPEFRAVQPQLAAMLAAHQTAIVQNRPLFERVKAVHATDAAKSLAPDQRRLLRLVYDQFARNGAALDGAARERYAAINQRLAGLQTAFANHVLADEEKYVLLLEPDQLGGLPPSFVEAAAALATARKAPGKYAVLNTRSSIDPFLTWSDRRDLREQVWRTYYSRGDNGDANDNNALIVEILALRHERSKLLGYPDYATWRLEDRMAVTPARAMALMESVWPAAIARVKQEVADMQSVADREGAKIAIAPWDYRYYAEKVRTERYAFDSDEVRQYLELTRLRGAMFYVAGELFGFRFTPVPDGQVPVFHPAIKVWEVTDRTSGRHVGLWYLDPFARTGKRSGAWAFSYRTHANLDGSERTVLSSNNSNFIESAPGEPVLISWGDARTYFHEFGHALHALSSGVRYPTLNRGVRDYTEFQSQLLERWILTEPVTGKYLIHAQTGAPMPAELVGKLRRAETFNTGFETSEYLASAMIDLKLHTRDPAGLDPDAFERDTLQAMGMPSEVVMRHRTPHFGHVFSSEGYAAGYYGYLWADVLASDATEAFEAAPGGFYDPELARKLVAHLFSVGNSVDPGEAYRAFRGRDATIDALLRDRGFPVP